MNRVAAVLLAAGESRRMGELNKLALPLAGVPLLRRTVETLLASSLIEVVVVIGHEADTSRSLLAGLPIKIVENERYRDGQMTSVYRGMEAVTADCDGVMICLTDQALLEPQDIDALIAAFAHRQRGSVLVPTYEGRRGNPIILAYEHRAAILGGDRNLGCKRLIEKNPQLVTTVEMANDHVVVDMDSPEDYRAVQLRIEQTRVA